YRLARRGTEVEMPVRRSVVHSLDLLDYDGRVARLDLRVGSGTYVRAIAEALGGHCRTLRRTEVGPFLVEEADEARLVPPETGLDETLVVEFTLDLAALEPEEFAERYLRRIGADVVVAGADFRFGRERRGDLALLGELGFDVRSVPLLEDVSSSRIRQLLRDGEVERAPRMLGRPAEVEGTVVSGDHRGGTLGFPTANLAVAPALLVPRYGLYPGSAAGHRAAIPIRATP